MQSLKNLIRKLPLLAAALALILSMLLTLPGALFAQEEEQAEGEEEQVEPEPEPEELEFNLVYPELQAEFGETFDFQFDVTYMMGDEPFGVEEGQNTKEFDIIVEYPEGWFAAATPQYEKEKEITAAKLTSGEKASLAVVAIPLVKQEPGEYKITAKVVSRVEGDTLEGSVELTAIISGTYAMDLATKTGRLSTEVTSGKDNHYTLTIENSGTDSIDEIKISSTEPEGWQVSLEPEKIDTLASGEKAEVDVTINAPEKTIAGDYMLSFSSKSEKAEDSIELRVTVETPTIWGIVGIAIIVVVIVAVAVIFARLGRR